MNAIIKVTAIIGICAAALGLIFNLIYPPLALLATGIFLLCLGTVLALEMKD